jgi:hypothetical protein
VFGLHLERVLLSKVWCSPDLVIPQLPSTGIFFTAMMLS